MEFSLDARTARLSVGEFSAFAVGPHDVGAGGSAGLWRAQLGTHWHNELRAQATVSAPAKPPSSSTERRRAVRIIDSEMAIICGDALRVERECRRRGSGGSRDQCSGSEECNSSECTEGHDISRTRHPG